MASFKKSTGIDIQEAFERFHKANPQVYVMFKEAIKKAMDQGKKKISAKTVLGYIRWQTFMQTKETTTYIDAEGNEHAFRINDAYTSRYARLFANDQPEHANIFNYKELRS